MANKEATIYILDVGPSLKTKREGSDMSRFEETKNVLLKLLANKVLFCCYPYFRIVVTVVFLLLWHT
jgi:hypothetical protein